MTCTTNLAGRTEWESEQYRADGGMHARLAQGLREMAHYIETHPSLPIPSSVEAHYCIPADSDKDGDDEAFRIAAIIGTTVTGDDDGSSSEAVRDFGPSVSYRAVYLARARMSAYQEHMAPYHAAQSAAKQEVQAAA